MMNKNITVSPILLFLIPFASAMQPEFSQCICDGCTKDNTLGLKYRGICYFIPLSLQASVKIASGNKFEKLNLKNIEEKYIFRVERLIQQLAVKSFITQNISNINFLFNSECKTFDVLDKSISEHCTGKHTIFLDSNSDPIESPILKHLFPCSPKHQEMFHVDKNRCIYLTKNGHCDKDDQLINIDSTEIYKNVERYILLTDLQIIPKIVVNISLPSNINSIFNRSYIYSETLDTNDLNKTCFYFIQGLKRVEKRTGKFCEQSIPLICEHSEVTNMDSNEHINRWFIKLLIIVAVSVIVFSVIPCVGKMKERNQLRRKYGKQNV